MEGHGQVIFAYGSNGTARGYRDRDDKISSLSESLLHIDLYGITVPALLQHFQKVSQCRSIYCTFPVSR